MFDPTLDNSRLIVITHRTTVKNAHLAVHLPVHRLVQLQILLHLGQIFFKLQWSLYLSFPNHLPTLPFPIPYFQTTISTNCQRRDLGCLLIVCISILPFPNGTTNYQRWANDFCYLGFLSHELVDNITIMICTLFASQWTHLLNI